MNFRFAIHNQIKTVLQCLDSDRFNQTQAYFGGGTVLAIALGEYRQSKDIDFICPIATSGYKQLRRLIFESGHEALFSNLHPLQFGRCTTDQYGIRLLIKVNEMPLKLEIIAEARFIPESPRFLPWSQMPCLSWRDCFISKLLANADRFMDESVQSRDLIDLAMLRSHQPIPEGAIAKAENAYEVVRPLQVAIERFQAQPDYRERCYERLQIAAEFSPHLVNGLDLLAGDFGGQATTRLFKEQVDWFGEDECF